jgi:hypothetical protein
MDLETEARNDCASEGKQQFNWLVQKKEFFNNMIYMWHVHMKKPNPLIR